MNKEMKFSKSLAHGIILAERRQRVSRSVFSPSERYSWSIFCHFTIRSFLRDEEVGGGMRREGGEGVVEEGDRDEVPLRILLQGLLSLLNSLLWA